MVKKAIITGITGQDGAYLTRFLLDLGYQVYGTYRRTSTSNFWRLAELNVYGSERLKLVEVDLTDLSNCIRLVDEIRPDEIYHLAAQSHVGTSFKQPLTTALVTGIGPVHLLEAVKLVDKSIRFYQASTSEMFGKVQQVPQDESTPFYPRSPYGAAKLFAHCMAINYREAYGMFCSSGILFNHESPLRGIEFVTRKITDAVARIKYGKLDCLELGNLDARRDWGYAKEYVEGMYNIIQHDEPETFVLATGVTQSVRDFIRYSFECIGVDIDFSGSGVDEVGFCKKSGKQLVKINPEFFRPAEVDLLIGNAGKAKRLLGWQSNTSVQTLCELMVQADLKRQQV